MNTNSAFRARKQKYPLITIKKMGEKVMLVAFSDGGGEQPKKSSNQKHVRDHFDFGFDSCCFFVGECLSKEAAALSRTLDSCSL